MKQPLLWLFGLLLLLWLFLGSFLSNRFCNCGGAAAAAAPLIVPATGTNNADASAINIADSEKNFVAGTNDNLHWGLSTCDYVTPISDRLTTVFKETADHLKNNPQRILLLTGLHLGTEENKCTDAKDLGFGRADKVKQMLIKMGAPAAQIRVQSDKRELATKNGTVVGGVLYEFVSGDIGEVEKRLLIGNLTLYFDTNEKEINLSAEQQKYFDDLKDYLRQKPEAKAYVRGHTDNRSNDKYNVRLSRKRAEFARDYMVKNGIPEKQIVTEGKGPFEPVETNDTEEGRAKNRRTEIKIQ